MSIIADKCAAAGIQIIEDAGECLIVYRVCKGKIGGYKFSDVLPVGVKDDKIYFDLSSVYSIKVDKKIAAVDCGEDYVRRAVNEGTAMFLNEAGEMVPACFVGGALVDANTVVRKRMEKVGVKMSSLYKFTGATNQETTLFARRIVETCEKFGASVNVHAYKENPDTTCVRIKRAYFKTRSGALSAANEIRRLFPLGCICKVYAIKI
jgi:hypothetical protein